MRSPGVPGRASAAGTLPGMRLATARHSAPVMGTARCGWPEDIILTIRSTSAASTCRPERVRDAYGGAVMATNGIPLPAAAASRLPAMPIATEAACRIASKWRRATASASSSAGSSRPVLPKEAAATKTQGLPASTIETLTDPSPATSRTVVAEPSGSRRPVAAPPGCTKSRRMGAPVPLTPSIERSPSTRTWPPWKRKRDTTILPVFVLWILTRASPSSGAATRPSSTANGPMAADMLPQFRL